MFNLAPDRNRPMSPILDIITSGRLPIKSWCEAPEPGCLRQAVDLTSLPFLFRHVALMPDAHQGYGMPIGGVIAALGRVIPNAVGVDIGCGVVAARTDLPAAELPPEKLKRIVSDIRRTVPTGFDHHPGKCPVSRMPGPHGDLPPVSAREFGSARTQLSTLGGGNHFIEIQRDPEGMVWLMIHSGSRNLGKQVADHYNRAAAERGSSQAPADLASLPLDSREGADYMREMDYCLAFAKANRAGIMDAVEEALISAAPGTRFLDRIDIHHNYAALETHFGREVLVHRKGATAARRGQTGIVPGSQGSVSYIVEGLGEPESFMSCSHGAGRRMGRKEAVRSLDLKEEILRLDEKGVLHRMRSRADLDEAASAYKDIEAVMSAQSDLARPVIRLEPLAVIKG